MKRFLIILITGVLLACGSVKKTINKTENEVKQESLEQENNELKLLINELKELKLNTQLSSENLSLNLSALSGDKPAVYSEIKGKDTVYKVVVQNGVLTKSQLKKDSSLTLTIHELKKELQELKTQKSTQAKSEQKQTSKTKQIKRNHHWFWFGLIGIVVGLIVFLRKFKRCLKRD